MMRNPGHGGAVASLALAAALLAAAGGARAQDPGEPLHTFFAPVEVPLVNVDVYVADRQGRPLAGLGVDDFEVLADGEPVAISHFYAAPGVAAPTPEEPTIEDAPVSAEGTVQDLYLVIFVDDTNLQRGRRQAALDHVAAFLGSELPQGLEIMVVRYDGAVQVEQAFTGDILEVSQALQRVAARASISRALDEERLLAEMDNALTASSRAGMRAGDVLASSGDSVMREIDVYVEQTVQRVQAGIDDQKRYIRSLSGLEGRKALLLVSDGVEARVGERLYRAWGEAFGSSPAFQLDAQRAFLKAARNDLSNEFDELARTANAHRVSLYTLSGTAESVAQASSAERRFADAQGLLVQQAMSADVLMSSMADTTGGRVLVNSPALARQLDEVAEELASYYSLAFEPPRAGDGAYHRLEVRVRRDGARVRHREGWLDVPPSERLENRTLAAAVHGIGDNPLGISLESGEALPRDDGTMLLPIIISVPIAELVLLPGEEEHQGSISILLAVRDDDGGLSPLQLRQYPVPVQNLDLPTALGQRAGFTLRLGVRPGSQRIAVGVRDDIGRIESVATLEVEVGDAGS